MASRSQRHHRRTPEEMESTMPMMDESLLRCSRSSSPFVSELNEGRSRNTSKHYQATLAPENVLDDIAKPVQRGLDSYDLDLGTENKENEPAQKTSPLRSSVGRPETTRRSSTDHELMPPPSNRTPRRSPFKTAPTLEPRPSSRTGSVDNSELSISPLRALDQPRHDSTGIDDTCCSNFSEVPDLISLRNIQSPAKRLEALRTPRTSRKRSSPSRSPSPTPRRQKTPSTARDGTTLLIDFTQQMEDARLPSSRTEPNLLQHLNKQRSPGKYRQSLATPAKQSNILNLLDFELPPAPTPRSIPTITVRELETLKSQYLSQISSLKATLNGREAEVESLKRAVGDAERRVGDAQQALNEEKNTREHAEQERMDWERRGMEVENVLNNVREEVLKSESEKDELLLKMEELERQIEDADARSTKAEQSLAEALALHTVDGDMTKLDEQVQRLVAAQIDAKVEAVSRELHAVYKEKHERKVATLKKSYEARSEKRCADMQIQLRELERTNAELLSSRKDTSTSDSNVSLRAEMEEHKAHLARLGEELATSREQQDDLVRALEQERIEKGDLVAAVDEMLALQSEQGPTQAALSVVEDFRKSISRPPPSSALRRPSESRIGIPSLRTPAPSKSRILANIEKMGRSVVHD